MTHQTRQRQRQEDALDRLLQNRGFRILTLGIIPLSEMVEELITSTMFKLAKLERQHYQTLTSSQRQHYKTLNKQKQD